MTLKLSMSESDIVRAMKNNQFSPVQVLASRFFKEDLKNVEADKDGIFIWNDDINDYQAYRYIEEDQDIIIDFLEEWEDYENNYIDDFAMSPISFSIEKKK
jgi:hypothetical protein